MSRVIKSWSWDEISFNGAVWTAACSLASHWNCCSSKLLSVLLLLCLSFVFNFLKFPFYFLNKEYTLIPLQGLSSLYVILRNTGLNILQYRLNKDLNKEIILDFYENRTKFKNRCCQISAAFFLNSTYLFIEIHNSCNINWTLLLTQSPSLEIKNRRDNKHVNTK